MGLVSRQLPVTRLLPAKRTGAHAAMHSVRRCRHQSGLGCLALRSTGRPQRGARASRATARPAARPPPPRPGPLTSAVSCASRPVLRRPPPSPSSPGKPSGSSSCTQNVWCVRQPRRVRGRAALRPQRCCRRQAPRQALGRLRLPRLPRLAPGSAGMLGNRQRQRNAAQRSAARRRPCQLALNLRPCSPATLFTTLFTMSHCGVAEAGGRGGCQGGWPCRPAPGRSVWALWAARTAARAGVARLACPSAPAGAASAAPIPTDVAAPAPPAPSRAKPSQHTGPGSAALCLKKARSF